MMRSQFYDLASGVFIGRGVSGSLQAIEANTPAGCGAYIVPPDAPKPDPLSQRVDLKTGELVDYQPPAPPDDELQTWDWDDKARRWVAQATELAIKQQRVRELQAAIEAREAGQARIQRELLLAIVAGKAPPPEAMAKLAAIDADVATLRGEISGATKVG